MVMVRYKNVAKKVKSGKEYYYFRIRRPGEKERLIPLPGTPESVEFREAYEDIRREREQSVDRRPYSVTALIEDYLRSPKFADLGDRTKKDYRGYLDYIREKIGSADCRKVRRHHIIKARDANQERRRFANYVVQVASIIFEHAIDLGWRTDNPAKGVERLRGGKGYSAWSDEQIAAFREKVNDPLVKFGFELALATGQRPSDVIGLNWSDFDGEGITLIPNKTGKNRQENELYIPLKEDVIALIEARKLRRKSTRMLESEQGRPLGYHAFEYRLRQARKAAGVEGVSMHGLRKNAVRELLEAGCSDAEVMAITGHRSREMVSLYGRSARQRLLAISAIKKRTLNG